MKVSLEKESKITNEFALFFLKHSLPNIWSVQIIFNNLFSLSMTTVLYESILG